MKRSSLSNKSILTASILALGVCFVLLGIYRGEADSVLKKAVYICLECIGIG